MQSARTIAHWIVRLTGVAQVGLGLLFWTGLALSLLPLHMVIGLVFVLAILTLAGLAAGVGLPALLVLLAVAYGILIPAFGMMQQQLLPGPGHWMIRVLHLLIGIGGMILADRLAAFIRSSRAVAAPSAGGLRSRRTKRSGMRSLPSPLSVTVHCSLFTLPLTALPQSSAA